jgi:hypothetical protein
MRDPHATLFWEESAGGDLEELRRMWDPVMAAQIAAHVTVTYPAEIPTTEPHVTIVHPRTSEDGAVAWKELAGTSLQGETIVERVVITAFDGRRWQELSAFRLQG